MAVKTTDVLWSRLFRLDADSGMSLQDQIRRHMVSAISDGHLKAGTPVPSGRELAEHLKVARNTVVLAYQQLVDEGVLISKMRSGYFVNPDTARNVAWQHQGAAQPSPSAPDWTKRLRFTPSIQRNIAKAADWQTYKYPFICGQYDPKLFPTNEWRECCQKVLSVMEIRDWAPDLITRDDERLIEEVRTKVLPLRGVWASPDEIMITIGAQHALYTIADLLLSTKTRIGIEDPGYPDARNIFASRTSHLTAIPVDEHGLKVGPELANFDYLYATPSHQSPTTATMTMERRVELLKIAEREDIIIIEDDYETETTFSGLPNPALKSLDRNNRVIYIGSLSKTLAPGLRLGYIVAPAPLIVELRLLRRLMIRHPASFIQRSFALFLSLGHYDTLSRKLVQANRHRSSLLHEAIARNLPATTTAPVNGGSSFWLTGPAWLDSRELAAVAKTNSILIEPGDVYFMANAPPRRHFRLGFSSIQPDRIAPGIKLLGELMRNLER